MQRSWFQYGYGTKTNLAGLRDHPTYDGIVLLEDFYSILSEFLAVDFDECKNVVELQHVVGGKS